MHHHLVGVSPIKRTVRQWRNLIILTQEFDGRGAYTAFYEQVVLEHTRLNRWKVRSTSVFQKGQSFLR